MNKNILVLNTEKDITKLLIQCQKPNQYLNDRNIINIHTEDQQIFELRQVKYKNNDLSLYLYDSDFNYGEYQPLSKVNITKVEILYDEYKNKYGFVI